MSEARIQLDGDMSGCYCGEFDRPTIAPDEFGETCFHERGKCEVPPVPVPIETVLRLTRARAEQAEAAIARVREVHTCTTRTLWSPSLQQAISVQECQCGQRWPCVTIRALEGDA